ncbi:MAG: MFS transporter [Nitrospinae bacterium]|nr:MFS transporter [Nitrospinota bacterium]
MEIYNKKSKKVILSWCMYDWANSGFATTIMAAVLPVFYSSVAAVDLTKTQATSYWGYTNSVGMLLIALSAPILGAIADHSGTRKGFLCIFASVGIVFTGLMVLISTGDWLMASIFFIFASIGFAGANIFYDSLLPHVAGKDKIDQISTMGYALGYLGGGLLLLINIAMILRPSFFYIPDPQWGYRLSFLSVAIWWGLFSIPIFMNVKEPKPIHFIGESKNWLKAGFQRLCKTFGEVRRFTEAFKFLIAFWIYNDGIGTIIIMATIFGNEIGIAHEHLIGAILAVQFVGVPFSILFGRLSRLVGPKISILIGLIIYTGISIGGYFMYHPLHFWILAILVGVVQGGTQALSRSLYGRLIPKDRSAEFFGFYDISSKFSGIIGPMLFGIVGQITGSSRLGIISLVIFFIVGGVILTSVNEE